MDRSLALIVCLWLSPLMIAGETFEAAGATNDAGLDVFRQLRTEVRGNLILSPYSIESALVLACEGADGDTRAEMKRVLRLPADDAALPSSFGALRAALDRMVTDSQDAEIHDGAGGKRDAIEWRVANRLFGRRGYAFRDSFLTLMRDRYQAPFQPARFREAAEQERRAINDWVAEQTAKRIKEIVPRGSVTADTRLVLVNALYLKAPWLWPFSARRTQPQAFHFADGSTSDVSTMRESQRFGYARENQATIVTLPYAGQSLQFVIILPDPGVSLDSATQQLSREGFARWAVLPPERRRVDLSLPKLCIESSTLPLSAALKKLGMRQAFDVPPHSANFDRIAPRSSENYLYISEVFHRTFVAVDEKGTEAAAATAAVMFMGAVQNPEGPIEVHVDRPFLLAIQHRPTGVCLFLGQITDPR